MLSAQEEVDRPHSLEEDMDVRRGLNGERQPKDIVVIGRSAATSISRRTTMSARLGVM